MNRFLLSYDHSGVNLIEEINSLNPELVIDVGCGTNFFKNKIKNLIGFDMINYPNIDYNCTISDMIVKLGSVDVVLALGSLQDTNREQIYQDISKIVDWLKPGGFIVVRNKKFVSESKSANSGWGYYWSQEWFNKISEDFNLTTIKGPVADGQRIVWWWKKNN